MVNQEGETIFPSVPLLLLLILPHPPLLFLLLALPPFPFFLLHLHFPFLSAVLGTEAWAFRMLGTLSMVRCIPITIAV